MLNKFKLIKNISLFLSIVFLLLTVFANIKFIFALIPLLGLFILYALCLSHLRKMTTNGKRIQFIEGGPRVGKTDAGTTLAVVLALKQWNTVCRIVQKKWKKYKRICDIINKEQFCSDRAQSFIYTYNEAQKCYSYYKNHPEYIPCLTSTISILYGDKKSRPMEFENITGQAVLPYMTVIYATEVSSLFPIDSYMTRAESQQLKMVANFFERIGHYIDGYLIMDTQDADNVSKDVKRLFPSILKIDCSLSKVFKLFGMRGFKIKDNERLQDGETVVREDRNDGYKTIILPCAIGEYDERHLRTLYPSKEQIIKDVGVENLIIEDTAENRKLYNREAVKK